MMPDSEARYQSMLEKLQERGCRVTSHRLALLRLVAVSEGHPNASQLYEKMRVQFPTVSLATIYKTLALLKEEGEILEIELGSTSHFDGNKPYPHPHLVCNRCGRILDGDAVSTLHTLNAEVESRYDFQVVQTQLVFFGICRECQKNYP